MKTMIINDLHLGVKRQTGTTLQSRTALEEFTLEQFCCLLNCAWQHGCSRLVILGDLFDSYNVPKQIEIEVYTRLKEFVETHQIELVLVAGNHDLSTNSNTISSFENLCSYLGKSLYGNLTVVQGETWHFEDVAIVPHMPNQELFQEQLDIILNNHEGLKYVMLHCNFDNHFAAQTDHSLNVSAETAQAFAEKGITLIFAHEHHAREVGNCVVIGNQIPTSIADCLGDTAKRYAIIDETGINFHEFLQIADIYEEVDWRSKPKGKAFIRMVGSAEAEESPAVIDALGSIRSDFPDTFIIGNAVKVGNFGNVQGIEAQVEALDIRGIVCEGLSEPLLKRLQEVMNHD